MNSDFGDKRQSGQEMKPDNGDNIVDRQTTNAGIRPSHVSNLEGLSHLQSAFQRSCSSTHDRSVLPIRRDPRAPRLSQHRARGVAQTV